MMGVSTEKATATATTTVPPSPALAALRERRRRKKHTQTEEEGCASSRYSALAALRLRRERTKLEEDAEIKCTSASAPSPALASLRRRREQKRKEAKEDKRFSEGAPSSKLAALRVRREQQKRADAEGRRRCVGRRRTGFGVASVASFVVVVLVALCICAPGRIVVDAVPAPKGATSGPLIECDGNHVRPLEIHGDAYFNYLVEPETGYIVMVDEETGCHTYAVWKDDDDDNDFGGGGGGGGGGGEFRVYESGSAGSEEGEGEEEKEGTNHRRSDHANRGHHKGPSRRRRAAVQGGGSGGGGGGHFVSTGIRVPTFEGSVSAQGEGEAAVRPQTESELGPKIGAAAERARVEMQTADIGDAISTRHSRAPFPDRRSLQPGAWPPNYDHPDTRKQYRGNFAVLVLLVRFADHRDRPLPDRSQFDIVMNHDGHYPSLTPEGSVKDVFRVNSNGLMDLHSVIPDVGWIDLPHNHSYYVEGQRGWGTGAKFKEGVQYAYQQLEDDPSFSFVDAMGDAAPSNGGRGFLGTAVFHSGYAAEWGGIDCVSGEEYDYRIWSHMRNFPFQSQKEPEVAFQQAAIQSGVWGTCGSNVAHIGVVAHEIGHVMGLPDMIGARPGNGIGAFDMMCNSWGFDGSGHYPPKLNAHSKLRLGWVEPTKVTKSGTYTLRASHSSLDALRIDYGFPPGEYLLLENRQPSSFDSKIPGAGDGYGGGIAIWHVDDLVGWSSVGGHPWMNITQYADGVPWPENGAHYNVNLLAADGDYHLEKWKGEGHVSDLWAKRKDTGFNVGMTELGPGGVESDGGPYPNTDTYQNGIVTKTGVYIRDFSAPGEEMSVTILLGDDDLASSLTDKPSTARPSTARPTPVPTPRPTATPASISALLSVYYPLESVRVRFSNPNVALLDDWIAIYPASVQELPGGRGMPAGVTDWAFTCGSRSCFSGDVGPRNGAASTEGIVSFSAVRDAASARGGWIPGTEYVAYLCRNTEAPYEVVARSSPFRLEETAEPTAVPTGKPTVRPTPQPSPKPSIAPTRAPSTAKPTTAKPTRRPAQPGTEPTTTATPAQEPKTTLAPTEEPTTAGPSASAPPSRSPSETAAPTTSLRPTPGSSGPTTATAPSPLDVNAPTAAPTVTSAPTVTPAPTYGSIPTTHMPTPTEEGLVGGRSSGVKAPRRPSRAALLGTSLMAVVLAVASLASQ